MSLRHSTCTKTTTSFVEISAGYPDTPPANKFEEEISQLNQEAFPTADFTRVDDIIFYSLFATKSQPNYRALDPSPASLTRKVSSVQGAKIAATCVNGISQEMPTRQAVSIVTMGLVKDYPDLFFESDQPIIEQ